MRAVKIVHPSDREIYVDPRRRAGAYMFWSSDWSVSEEKIP